MNKDIIRNKLVRIIEEINKCQEIILAGERAKKNLDKLYQIERELMEEWLESENEREIVPEYEYVEE